MTDFKKFEAAAWEEKASRYHDTWGLVTSQPNIRVLDLLSLKEGASLFDCGCGPGHLVYEASRRGITATGGDYSLAMVEIAKKNYPHLHFLQVDAEALTLPESSFDAVVLNYLLLHVPDQERALKEASRVLRTGGELLFTLWLPPAKSPGFALMFDAIKLHADTSVIPPAQDIFRFADPLEATNFLAKSGFTDITTEHFETSWRFATFDSFFKSVQAGIRIGGMIERQKPENKAKIFAAMESGISRFASSEGYLIPTPSIIVKARKVK